MQSTEKEKMIQEQTDQDIILFNPLEDCGAPSCLKQFLSFLKMQSIPAPPRFAYVDTEGSLLPGLTLKENISLDSIPSTISSTARFTLEDHLERIGNKHLVKLYQFIELTDDCPYQVDSRTRKIAALVKGLLQRTDFLFLENPEKYLSKEVLRVFKAAMLTQLNLHKQTLLIKAHALEEWTPLITKTVTPSLCAQTGRLNLDLQERVTQSFEVTAGLKLHKGMLIFNHPGSSPLQKDKNPPTTLAPKIEIGVWGRKKAA
jgi:ABC-type thiamine transport system ATPase subunit